MIVWKRLQPSGIAILGFLGLFSFHVVGIVSNLPVALQVFVDGALLATVLFQFTLHLSATAVFFAFSRFLVISSVASYFVLFFKFYSLRKDRKGKTILQREERVMRLQRRVTGRWLLRSSLILSLQLILSVLFFWYIYIGFVSLNRINVLMIFIFFYVGAFSAFGWVLKLGSKRQHLQFIFSSFGSYFLVGLFSFLSFFAGLSRFDTLLSQSEIEVALHDEVKKIIPVLPTSVGYIFFDRFNRTYSIVPMSNIDFVSFINVE